MLKIKMKFKVLGLVLLISLIFGTTIIASSMDELEEEKVNIEKAFEEAQKGLAESREELVVVNSSIKNLELEIVEMKYQIDDLEALLDGKKTEVDDIKLELLDIRVDQDTLYDQAKQRIKVLYEYGNAGYLEVLFDSDDMVDFFNRLEYINRLVEFDLKLFQELDQFEEEILAQESQLEVQEAELIRLTNEANLQKNQLENVVVSKNLEVQNILDDQGLYEQMMDDLEEAEKQVDAEIKELIRQSKLKYAGGKMEWPTPGWYRITSPFGPRLHPIYKTWRMHNGLDIGAGGGTTIVAAASGEIIVAKYNSAYGNYVIIDHGSGYATLYAHCSKLLVAKGQAVVRGEQIAKVGSTGWSTGNHLHFGVQLYGEWQDPIEYIK